MAPEARRHLTEGLRHFEAHEYAKAIEEFQKGYAIDPRPEFLYATAQAQRLGGDCEQAVHTYGEFLRTHPTDLQAETARQNQKKCQEVLAARPAPKPEPPRAPAPPPEPVLLTALPPPAPPPPPARSWYQDPLGDVLVGAGVAAVVVGGLVWKSGRDDASAANAAASYDQFITHADGAETRQQIGVATAIAGAGLIAGGIVRYLLLPRAQTRAAVVPQPGGATVVVGARFW